MFGSPTVIAFLGAFHDVLQRHGSSSQMARLGQTLAA
jgi:hypothetical protein